ncbi:MAG: hypothetical protein ACI4EQ_01005 [Lachnospiraceae bacterium]
MKKLNKVIAMAMMMILLAGLTACGNRTAVSVSEFNNVLEDKGYIIEDATGQIAPESITAISLAVGDDYQIEFYEFKNNAAATAVFNENKNIFESYASGGASAEITKNIMNYSYYSVTSSGTYYMLAKIDNTMLYAVADSEYKDEIVEIVKELGY